MQDYKLSEIKEICKIHHCITDCPIYHNANELCRQICFGDKLPEDWEIDKDNDNA